MSPCVLRLAVSLFLLAGSTVGAGGATVFDLTADAATGRAIRLALPEDGSRVRGVLIWGNGASGDSRGMAANAELLALARAHRFALAATAYWANFSDPAEYTLFTRTLRDLGTQSGHPEIETGIWLPIGHSNGGQMSYGLNALAPVRVAAFAVSKGGYYNVPRPSEACLATPGILVAGQADTALRVSAIADLFTGNRPRGALWAWVEEEGRDHAEGESAELIRPYVDEMLRTRYPLSDDTGAVPPALKPLNEAEGWLVEPTSFRRGWAEISPCRDYPADRRAAGWLPSQRLAFLFRAFASYAKATTDAALLSPGGLVVDSGASVGYRIGSPAGDWTSVDFYEGATLLASRSRAEAADLAVHLTATGPGYAVFHAVVHYADGSRRTTPPRRVFVNAPAPGPVPAPLVSWSSYDGHSCVLHWTPVEGATVYRIERAPEAVDSWTVVATTSDTQLDEPAMLAEITFRYRVVATASGRDIVSSDAVAVQAPVMRAPRARLVNLSARAKVGQGDETLIAGFVHDGGDKRVLLRAVGPTLAHYGVRDPHPDPRLRLMNSERVALLANDDWAETAAAADLVQAATLGSPAFALPLQSKDAAVVTTLRGDSAAHTVLVEGASGSGVALAEVYDADPGGSARLINLSARALVQNDSGALIVGIILSGTDAATVLFRAAGPALRAYGVGGILANPVLSLNTPARGELWHVSGSWSSQPNAGQIRLAARQFGAFAFAEGSSDVAMLVTLNPGAYTLVVSGAERTSGVVLVEAHAIR